VFNLKCPPATYVKAGGTKSNVIASRCDDNSQVGMFIPGGAPIMNIEDEEEDSIDGCSAGW